MRPALALAALALAAALAACAPPRPPVGVSLRPEDPRLVRGMEAYMEHCQQCHPSGAAGLGPSLNDKPLPSFLVKLQVRAGLGAMPAFGPDRIGDETLDDLVAYVLELRERAAATAGTGAP